MFEDGQILDKVLTDYGLGLDSDWTDPVLGQRLDKVWTNIGQNLDKGWISCPMFVQPPLSTSMLAPISTALVSAGL